LVAVAALATALITVWALRRAGQGGETSVTRGDEVFAIDPRTMTELRYTSRGASAVAKRVGQPAGTYEVEVRFTDPPARQKCRSGATFARLLNELSSVRVKTALIPKDRDSVLDAAEARGAKLELLDDTPIDPKEFRVVMFGTPPRLVFIDGPLAYEPSISPELFDRLSGGCPALSDDLVTR
jgi:hypothetical protein